MIRGLLRSRPGETVVEGMVLQRLWVSTGSPRDRIAARRENCESGSDSYPDSKLGIELSRRHAARGKILNIKRRGLARLCGL